MPYLPYRYLWEEQQPEGLSAEGVRDCASDSAHFPLFYWHGPPAGFRCSTSFANRRPTKWRIWTADLMFRSAVGQVAVDHPTSHVNDLSSS